MGVGQIPDTEQVTVTDADQAASVAACMATEASLQPTFGVGGALIANATGQVVHQMHNRVLQSAGPGKSYVLFDPTAHGERQLVDWYYENRSGLPPPSEMTVVTSLDPCAMCSGALLTAGFNVAVNSIDTFAGINYDKLNDFPSLPPGPRTKARETWGYYGVEAPVDLPYKGAKAGPVFAGQEIQATTYEASLLVFEANVEHIRSLSSNSGVSPKEMLDPKKLTSTSAVRKALEVLYPKTLSVSTQNPRFPGPELRQPLSEAANAARQRGAAFNSVALLDPFGNLLACLGGNEQVSPIKTAFLELTRGYAEMRWELMNGEPNVATEAGTHLTHPKYCTFVSVFGPDPSTAAAVMTFGAYGSTMEGPLPQPFPSAFQYVAPPPGVSPEKIAELAASLPPLYTNLVGVAPQQVMNKALADAIDIDD